MERPVLMLLFYFIVFYAHPAADGKVLQQEYALGGEKSSEGLFPWMVALYFKEQYVCSASLISDKIVITAAHCVVRDGILQNAGDFSGNAGSVNRSSPELRIKFASIHPHPYYNEESLSSDIAILKSKQEINFTQTIQPICLDASSGKHKKYRHLLLTGWGESSKDGKLDEILHFVWLMVVKNNFCSLLQRTVTPSTLCTIGINRGICSGDSGGPLIHVTDKGKNVLVGIASYINPLMGCGKLSMFIRVTQFLSFILDTAGRDNQICILTY